MGNICPTCRRDIDDELSVCPYDGTPLGTLVMDRLLGVALGGRYVLHECLGARGVFRTYVGEEQGTSKSVLVTLTERDVDSEAFARFRELAEKLSTVDHPVCTPIRDFGRTEGLLYLVEEGERWHRLDQELAAKGRLPVALALDLGAQLLEGLDHLHGHGVVHGRLSPSALGLTRDEEGNLRRLLIPGSDIPCRAVDPRDLSEGYVPAGREAGLDADVEQATRIMVGMLTGAPPPETAWSPPPLGELALEGERLQRLRGIIGRGLGLDGPRYGTAAEMLRELQAIVGQSRFGRYDLLRQIGQGGMGEVYLARAEGIEGMDLDRLCVIKTIRTSLADDPTFVDRFLGEARVLASLTHGNIVPVYDVGKVGTTFYIAMQYVAGKDVRQIISRAKSVDRRLPVPLALFIAKELANGLAYAHRAAVRGSQGLVHRDVSPHNVLVSYEGEVRLIDFGLVQAATQAPTAEHGVVMGKICYLSPEQAAAQPLDRRTDIFSAGLVLFELVVGEPFFNQPTVDEVMAKVASPLLHPPSSRARDIPPEVDRICLKAMAVDREQRYSSAADLRDDLAAELARIAPRTNPEEVGAFVRELFATEQAEEQRTLTDLSATLPLLPGGAGGEAPQERRSEGVSLIGVSPTPVQLAGTLRPEALAAPKPPAPAPPAAPARVPDPSQPTLSVPALHYPDRQPGRGIYVVAVLVALSIVVTLFAVTRWRRAVEREKQILARGVPTLAVLTIDAGRRPTVVDAVPDAGAAPPDQRAPMQRVRPRRPRPAPKKAAPSPTCKLKVIGGPQGAEVLVNGRLVGTLPLAAPVSMPAEIPLGITIRRGEARPFRTRLTCRPGETVRVRAGVRVR